MIWRRSSAEGIKSFDILFIDNLNVSSSLRDTLLIDKAISKEEALLEIYRKLRPGDPPTYEFAEALVHNMFFSPERYDLSKVGQAQDESSARPRHPPRYDDAPEGGYHRGGEAASQAEGLPGRRRRHRPPGQQEGEDSRRASREPVQDGPRENGAGHQGKTYLSRDGDPHAPRPGQPETGSDCGQGLLRQQPALPVHGPDEPA